MTEPPATRQTTSRWWQWPVVALLLAMAVMFTLRWSTGIAERPPRWDERYVRVPIDDIIRDGWSMRTALDFEETKGPALIWPFAIVGKWLGGTLGDLRLVSLLWLVVGLIPLLAIADRCGIRGPPLVAVTGLYLLMPQQAVLGQLLMSETIFVTGTLALIWIALVGLTTTPAGDERRRELTAILLYGTMLAILLHLRVHAVATAGAICLVATMRSGVRSWPWWVATIVAGLLRLPLWLRWGGLVSPEYQYMHQIGGEGGDALFGLFHPQNVAYLLAASAPWAALLGVAAWLAARKRASRVPIIVGAVVGCGIVLLFPPSMEARLALPPVVADYAPRGELERYLGLAASLARSVDATSFQTGVLAILAALGGGGLGALWLSPRKLRHSSQTTSGMELSTASGHLENDTLRLLAAMTFWTLVLGIGLYSLTDAFVVDRYLLPWAALLPILWWCRLPKTLLAVQVLGLTLLCAGWTKSWLLR